VLVVVVSVVVAPQESKESRRLARIHENPAGESTRTQRENPAVRFAAERNLRNLTEKSTSKSLASFTANVPPPTRAPASAAFDVGALAAHLSSVEKSDEPGGFELDDHRNDA